MCAYVCRGSNLECAGGYGLFDVIDSLCRLQSQEGAVNILPHDPLFIFQNLVAGCILWACPSRASLSVITITYGDINDHALSNVFARLKDHWNKTDFSLYGFPASESRTCNLQVAFIWVCKCLVWFNRFKLNQVSPEKQGR